MINISIIIVSLALSFCNVFVVRIMEDDPDRISAIRSLLVVSSLFSPVFILGLDTVIGKIKRTLVTKLNLAFFVAIAFVFLLNFLLQSFWLSVALLAFVQGYTQYVAAQKLLVQKDLAFKIHSQLFAKLVVFIVLIIALYFTLSIYTFALICATIIIVGNVKFLGLNLGNMRLSRLTEDNSDVKSLIFLSTGALSALFVTDLMLRMPYLISLMSSSQIANEYDIAVAFTSTWVLPLLIGSRQLEVKAKYNYLVYLSEYKKLRNSTLVQTIILVGCSIVAIYISGRLGLMKENISNVYYALAISSVPALLLLIFPNITRMFFLSYKACYGDTLKCIRILFSMAAFVGIVLVFGSVQLYVIALSILLCILFIFLKKTSEEL